MNKKVNTKILLWVILIGGPRIAVPLIMKAIRCSVSKADKIARGKYQSGISELEQAELLKLTEMKAIDLFVK